MNAEADSFLPLKPGVFHLLLALLDGERHGYALQRQLESNAEVAAVLPGNLYRTLRDLAHAGLIRETDERPDPELDDQRRRYFEITTLGEAVVGAEARRLASMVEAARRHRLLTGE